MKIKQFFLATTVMLGLVGYLVAYSPTANAGLFEDAKKDACGGAQLKGTGTKCSDADTSQLDSTLQKIIDIISIVIGIVAVIMIIINGLKFITSGGDTNKVGSAKNGILYAVIGLVIVALAQFIVRFVLGNV